MPKQHHAKYCQATNCNKPLEGRQRKYCSHTCSSRESARRTRAIKGTERSLAPAIDVPEEEAGRYGGTFDSLLRSGLADPAADGLVPIEAVARHLGVTYDGAQKAVRGYRVLKAKKDEAFDWQLEERYADWIGHGSEPPDPITREYVDELVDGFVAFRDEFFLTESGVPYVTKEYHRHWISNILWAIYTGTKSLILSPPRHGKSELLVHFCVWLICRNPNIRILWIGGNREIAVDMVSSVREHLEENEQLKNAYLSPEESWKPAGRAGKAWTASSFKVATRTIVGVKAATLAATGRKGKILSRDCDLIICDDLEDHDSTAVDSEREKTRNWFQTQVLSRKMRHTGVVMIGSRQHYDDLYGYNLDDPTWDTIVESAHSDDCNEEWTESAPHDECMLFPELNPYSWLLELRQDYQAKGLIGLWEMVYLNRPRPEGMTVFSQEAVESCYDRTRRIGQMPESHYRLVAGLDPAAAGYQASFLWAYTLDDQRQYLVDLDNTKGGGIIEALRIIQTWYEKYRVAYWVIENNGLQQMYLQDLRVRDFCLQNNVVLEPHRTYINKLDPFFGVSAMSRLFNERVANLPFYGEEAKAKTKLYTRQLMDFTDQTTKRNRKKQDVLMASWFPQKVMRRWAKEHQASHAAVQYDASFADYQMTPDWEVNW